MLSCCCCRNTEPPAVVVSLQRTCILHQGREVTCLRIKRSGSFPSTVDPPVLQHLLSLALRTEVGTTSLEAAPDRRHISNMPDPMRTLCGSCRLRCILQFNAKQTPTSQTQSVLAARLLLSPQCTHHQRKAQPEHEASTAILSLYQSADNPYESYRPSPLPYPFASESVRSKPLRGTESDMTKSI